MNYSNNDVEMLRYLLNAIAKNFIEGLKTDTYKKALDTVENLEEMTDEEFVNLVVQRSQSLDDFERSELERLIKKRIVNYREDDPLSIREQILLDLQAMLNSHEYQNSK